MTFRFAAALAVVISTTAAQAAPPAADWRLATGVVKAGTLDSGIGDYSFTTRSPVGSKIFAVCKMDDLCEANIQANADDFITKVDRVRKVGPFATPKDLLDFIYSHYTGSSARGLVAVQDMVEHLYSPRLATLTTAANAKAEKEQEESPVVAPWMDDQEWKLSGYKIDVVSFGPGKARGDVIFTNIVVPSTTPQTYTFDLLDGGSGWLIDDVITHSDPSGKPSSLSDYVKTYIKPSAGLSEALSTQKGRTLEADASTGERSRTSLDRASICGSDEIAIFSCAIRKRTASLCASRDLGPSKGSMTYRFGKPGTIELAYPEPGVAPSKAFTAAVVDRGDYVRFVRNSTSYKIYSLVPQGRSPFGGIMIAENGKMVADLKCDGGADGLGFDNWAVMYKAKLPEDPDKSLDP